MSNIGQEKETYLFGDFRLETGDKSLSREGKPLSLTPKMYETLLVLLQNPGKIIEKEDLMQRIWHDRFVEENNLTFNIKMLRKILGDDARNPKYIETVARRGYRFIGEIRQPEVLPIADVSNEVNENFETEKKSWFRVFTASRVLAGCLAIGVISSIVYATFLGQKKAETIPILAKEFDLLNITTSGETKSSAISPDGKIVAFVGETDNKQGVWLRELETGKVINVIPPSTTSYYGMGFSRDSQTLYFVGAAERAPTAIYRIPVSGGSPTKLVSRTEGNFAISPDNRQIAYIRNLEKSFLTISDIDGKNERVVQESTPDTAFWDVDFSPDGRKLVSALGETHTGSQNMKLVEIDIETGEQTTVIDRKFFLIKSVLWFKDARHLLIAAKNKIQEPTRIWEIDRLTRELIPVSNGSLSYTSLTINSEQDKLNALAESSDFTLFTENKDGASTPRKLTAAIFGATPTRDNRIVYTNLESDSNDLWIMNADGSNQRQLTANDNAQIPVISPDNQFIYYASNKTGSWHVWRIRLDGTEQTQITSTNGGFPMMVSVDGDTVYYQKDNPKSIWKISISSKIETEMFQNRLFEFSVFSPDEKYVVFAEGGYKFNLIELASGKVVKTFQAPFKKGFPYRLNWIPDTNSFSFVLEQDDEEDTCWVQSLDSQDLVSCGNLGKDEISDLKFLPNGKDYSFIRGRWKHDSLVITGLR